MAPSALFNPMSQQLCHAHRQKSAAAGNDRFAVWPQLPALKIVTAHGREFTTVDDPCARLVGSGMSAVAP